MSLVKTQAIILRSRRWGEADRIVTFFTLRLGKVRGIARGARRLKSRLGSHLEPFACVDLTVFEKRNDSLFRISQVDMVESFDELRHHLASMSAAARMVNLVDGISPDRDPGPKIFHALLDGLRALQQGYDPSMTALVFQIQVLSHTGFRPQTDQCASCGKSESVHVRWFSPLAGGLICRACEQGSRDRCLPMSPGSVAFIQQARQLTFPLVTRLKAEGLVRREVEGAIDSYVSVVVGKPLPATDFLVAEPSAPYSGVAKGP